MILDNVQFDHKRKDVVICLRCNGTGQIHNYNKISDELLDECDRCGGSGRLQREVSVTYKPFRPLFSAVKSTESKIEFDREAQ